MEQTQWLLLLAAAPEDHAKMTRTQREQRFELPALSACGSDVAPSVPDSLGKHPFCCIQKWHG